jgi:hypothetical protein
MKKPGQLSVRDLVVGGRYLHLNGLFVRQIDDIEGDTVHWHDQFSSGSCGKRVFLRLCPSLAPAGSSLPSVQQAGSRSPSQPAGEFTIRDEANALTAFAFRNGFIEELHAGKPSPVLQQPGYSRISDDEMRRLMIEASEKLSQMLKLKSNDPARYDDFVRRYHMNYCRTWKRD